MTVWVTHAGDRLHGWRECQLAVSSGPGVDPVAAAALAATLQREWPAASDEERLAMHRHLCHGRDDPDTIKAVGRFMRRLYQQAGPSVDPGGG